MRRDRPQASRSRHRRVGRPILSLLIPGCSVAGDQDPSRLPVRFGARCRVGVWNVSSPHQGRELPCRALREDGCWPRMAARPVRVTRRAASAACGPPAGRGSGGRYARLSLVWACSSACYAEMSTLSVRLSMHVPEYSLQLSLDLAGNHRAIFSIVLVGNQIDASMLRHASLCPVLRCMTSLEGRWLPAGCARPL
jgi:hypothetical protein